MKSKIENLKELKASYSTMYFGSYVLSLFLLIMQLISAYAYKIVELEPLDNFGIFCIDMCLISCAVYLFLYLHKNFGNKIKISTFYWLNVIHITIPITLIISLVGFSYAFGSDIKFILYILTGTLDLFNVAVIFYYNIFKF